MGKSSKRTLDEATGAAPASDAPSASAAMDVDTPSKAKKSKKDKKDKAPAAADGEDADGSLERLAEIAKPLAVKKTGKHVLKLVKKASKSRHLKRGVKEVVKSIRKGEKGIIVLAADISPLDILTHIPLLAEEANCPYIWVTSKEQLGLASSTKRPTSCVMVAAEGMKRKEKAGEAKKDESKAQETEKEFQESYEEVKKEVEALEVAVPTY
ncbi:snoRNA-binding protein [Rhodotorula kratochvilovae]